MDTGQISLVDAFADEPMGGLSIPVVSAASSISHRQLGTIAGEFGAPGAVAPAEEGIRYGGPDGAGAVVSGAVAGAIGLLDRDLLEPGTHPILVAPNDGDEQLSVSVSKDRMASVDLPDQNVRQAEIEPSAVADALGLEVDAFEGITDDLPPGMSPPFGGTLLVGLDYLDGLLRADPAPVALSSVFDRTDTSRLVAFTFDTLSAGTDVHARVFALEWADFERPIHGLAIGGCSAYLANMEAFAGDVDGVRIESGHSLDRPAIATTDLACRPTVRGHAVSTLEGTISIPPGDGDDIIEV